MPIFTKENSLKIWKTHFQAIFLRENRRQGEGCERYLSGVLLNCLEHVKCFSGTSCESLERISAPEKQISIGRKPRNSSVAFSDFKKVKIAIFYSYFCFEGRFQAIFAKVHQKMDCKARKAFKDTLGVPLKCLYHRYDTLYSHRKHKSKIKDFLKKSDIEGKILY